MLECEALLSAFAAVTAAAATACRQAIVKIIANASTSTVNLFFISF